MKLDERGFAINQEGYYLHMQRETHANLKNEREATLVLDKDQCLTACLPKQQQQSHHLLQPIKGNDMPWTYILQNIYTLH